MSGMSLCKTELLFYPVAVSFLLRQLSLPSLLILAILLSETKIFTDDSLTNEISKRCFHLIRYSFLN